MVMYHVTVKYNERGKLALTQQEFEGVTEWSMSDTGLLIIRQGGRKQHIFPPGTYKYVSVFETTGIVPELPHASGIYERKI